MIELLVAIAVIHGGADSRIELYEDRGICSAPARQARWIPKQAQPISGCWIALQGGVRIVFLDGDIALVPDAEIKAPERV